MDPTLRLMTGPRARSAREKMPTLPSLPRPVNRDIIAKAPGKSRKTLDGPA
jgi:hypothetical protein